MFRMSMSASVPLLLRVTKKNSSTLLVSFSYDEKNMQASGDMLTWMKQMARRIVIGD